MAVASISNGHLAISVGGGLGLVMLLNTWASFGASKKRLIAWTRAAAEQGTPIAAEAERLMRWGFLYRANVICGFPFDHAVFHGSASHYPFLIQWRGRKQRKGFNTCHEHRVHAEKKREAGQVFPASLWFFPVSGSTWLSLTEAATGRVLACV